MPPKEDLKFLYMKIKLLAVGNISQEVLVALEYYGFKDITSIKSGKEALLACEGNIYGFVICDTETSDINGIEFVRKLRNDIKSKTRFAHVVLFLESQNVTKDTVSGARDSGITEMMLKPFEILALREKIESIFRTPRNFIISRGYTGPDRRRKKIKIEKERRKDK